MNDRPKEGIYLDAALGVIGEQIEERIDEMSRRRRLLMRVAVLALSAVTVVSGSYAAAALSGVFGSPDAAPAPAASTVDARVLCIDGGDAADAPFFTVSYRVPAAEDTDEVALCSAARELLASDAADMADSTPETVVAVAAGLFDETTAAAPGFVVEGASFAPLRLRSGVAAVTPTICVDARATIVLFARDDEQRIAVCTETGR